MTYSLQGQKLKIRVSLTPLKPFNLLLKRSKKYCRECNMTFALSAVKVEMVPKSVCGGRGHTWRGRSLEEVTEGHVAGQSQDQMKNVTLGRSQKASAEAHTGSARCPRRAPRWLALPSQAHGGKRRQVLDEARTHGPQ